MPEHDPNSELVPAESVLMRIGAGNLVDFRRRAEGWADRPQPAESRDDPALDACIAESLAGPESFEGLAALARKISPVIYYLS